MNAWAIQFKHPVAFPRGVSLQEGILRARAAEKIPDTVLFLEHAPVITLGQRGRTQYLLVTPEQLHRQGIETAVASRGGDVTYHGPGQLVMYPILRLGEQETDAHGYLHNLEEIAIRTAADFGVKAWRRKGMNGAWTDKGKIAAIGFRLKKWITMHGMSFNVCPNLDHFKLIVPCGLQGEPVSSLQEILGSYSPDVSSVRERMAENFETVLHRKLEHFDSSGPLPDPLRSAFDSMSEDRIP